MSDPFLGRDVATYLRWDNNALKLYNDAAVGPNGGGAFSDISAAIQQAQHFIFIADWSFHPLVRLTPHEPKGGKCVGDLLIAKALAVPDLLVAIHTWDHTNSGAPDPQNDSGNEIFAKLLKNVGQKGGVKNLLWRMSSRSGEKGATGWGWSHHQKFVVLDTACPGGSRRRMVTVFFGGLDLTKGRADWPAHPNLPEDPDLKHLRAEHEFEGKKYDDWYNAELNDRRDLPREAWHDIHGQLTGPAAWDFVREFVGRWVPDPVARPFSATVSAERWQVAVKFQELFENTNLVQQWESLGKLEPGFARVSAQVVRSMTRDHWNSAGKNLETRSPKEPSGKRRELVWSATKDLQVEDSIQQAYLKHISQAEKFIYIETQYFIGSGAQWGTGSVKNKVPETLVERIKKMKKDGKDFHVYILVPLFPEGNPIARSRVALMQRTYQWRTIEYMVRALYEDEGIRKEWPRYLSFYFLAQWADGYAKSKKADRAERVKAARRYMIYVHSKMMICDDRLLILGSANLNERSLAGGRDAEICAAISADSRNEWGIRELRRALWGEHLGKPGKTSQQMLGDWWEHPEAPECIKNVQSMALQNYLNFRQARRRSDSGHLCLWPLSYIPSMRQCVRGPLPKTYSDFDHELIPDHTADALLLPGATPAAVRRSDWSLAPNMVTALDLAE